MSKIVYAVAGEGFGHASRAHLVGQRLLDVGHDVMFAASQKALVYLRQYFAERVKEVFGMGFAYDKGYVQPLVTAKRNLVKLPLANRMNKELFERHLEPFGPDLLITDFEPFCAWWAWRKRVPFVSIDNEHMLIMCRLDHKWRDAFPRLTASVVTRCHYVGAKAYVVISFFRAPHRAKAVLAPPIVRPIVTQLEREAGEHVIVYSTTGTGKDRLLDVLGRFGDQRFYVYGYDVDEERGNCLFKKRSTEGFLTDLATSRGVVASAGFSLISECMYLRKRMLALPLVGQHEQIINARYIEKLGLGISSRRLDEQVLQRFFGELDKPISADERIIWPDNDRFFDVLDETLSRLGIRAGVAVS